VYLTLPKRAAPLGVGRRGIVGTGVQVAAEGGYVRVAEGGLQRSSLAPRSIACLAWACLSQRTDTVEAFLRLALQAVAFTTLSAWNTRESQGRADQRTLLRPTRQ
jgi:hypothetical protein